MATSRTAVLTVQCTTPLLDRSAFLGVPHFGERKVWNYSEVISDLDSGLATNISPRASRHSQLFKYHSRARPRLAKGVYLVYLYLPTIE
jgi:hypothetical protein